MQPELKSCPFCGNDKINIAPCVAYEGSQTILWRGVCSNQHCLCSVAERVTCEAAITLWNTRTQPQAPEAGVGEGSRNKLNFVKGVLATLSANDPKDWLSKEHLKPVIDEAYAAITAALGQKPTSKEGI
jgi:hypothetical protein